MVTTQKRRRTMRVPTVIALLAVAVVLLFLAGSATLGILGAHLDPTEDTFPVTLKNDTGGAVLLKQCDIRCDKFHETDHVGPGGTVSVNTTAANVANWWVVEDGSGRMLGCVNLQYDRKIGGAVVDISKTVPCP